MRRTLVVPAAGQGTRLKSTLPKVLTLVAGQPMVAHVLARFRAYCDRVVLVIHPSARDAIEAYLPQAPMPAELTEQVDATGMPAKPRRRKEDRFAGLDYWDPDVPSLAKWLVECCRIHEVASIKFAATCAAPGM